MPDINKFADIRSSTLDEDLFFSPSEETHAMRAKHGASYKVGDCQITSGYCPRCRWNKAMILRGWHGVTCSFCGYNE